MIFRIMAAFSTSRSLARVINDVNQPRVRARATSNISGCNRSGLSSVRSERGSGGLGRLLVRVVAGVLGRGFENEREAMIVERGIVVFIE